MTQKEMGEKLTMSGPSYSKYEYGLREPNLDTLIKLSKLFGETTDFLLGLSDIDSEATKLQAHVDFLEHITEKQGNMLLMIKDAPELATKNGYEVSHFEDTQQKQIQLFHQAKNKLTDYLNSIPKEKPPE